MTVPNSALVLTTIYSQRRAFGHATQYTVCWQYVSKQLCAIMSVAPLLQLREGTAQRQQHAGC